MRSRFNLRRVWVVLRNGKPVGVTFDKQIAVQAVKNCRKYDLTDQPAFDPQNDYQIVQTQCLTKVFVAPKGYARENGEKS